MSFSIDQRYDSELLCGSNNGTRAELMGYSFISGGSAKISDAHSHLNGLGYASLRRVEQTHLRTLAYGLPPALYVASKLFEEDVLELTEKGMVSACFAGELITKVLVPHDINGSALVGGHKTDNPIGPGIRREVYRTMLDAPRKGFARNDVVRGLSYLGLKRTTVASHFDRLEDLGILTSPGVDDGPLRIIAPSRRETIEEYLKLCDSSLASPDPSYIEALLDKDKETSLKIPALVEKSIVGSGRSEAYKIAELNTFFRALLNTLPHGTVVSSSQLACMANMDIGVVKTYLDRAPRSMGEDAAIRMLPDRAPRRERQWIAASYSNNEVSNG